MIPCVASPGRTFLVTTTALLLAAPVAHGQAGCEAFIAVDGGGGTSMLYRAVAFGTAGWVEATFETSAGLGVIAGLAGAELESFAVIVDAGTGVSTLVRCSGFYDEAGWTVMGSPIGFPEVRGLALHEGTLYGTSFDASTSRTSVIEIDPDTGLGSLVGTTDAEVQLVGLASADEGLFASSRPIADEAPALYEIDPATGAESFVATTPATLEGLGHGEAMLGGGAGGLYRVDPTGTIEPIDLGAPTGPVLAISGERCWSPTRRTSWARLKDGFDR